VKYFVTKKLGNNGAEARCEKRGLQRNGRGAHPNTNMLKRQLLIIGGAFVCSALILAQNLPSTVPSATREHEPRAPLSVQGFGWVFNLNGKKYEAKISNDQIADGPEWTPAVPLPLTFAKVEEIARAELRKLVSDDSTWELTELNLRRLSNDTESKWYYVVKLTPRSVDRGVIPDSFYLPISLSGEIGRIQVNHF
jgi:hypothetical protein